MEQQISYAAMDALAFVAVTGYLPKRMRDQTALQVERLVYRNGTGMKVADTGQELVARSRALKAVRWACDELGLVVDTERSVQRDTSNVVVFKDKDTGLRETVWVELKSGKVYDGIKLLRSFRNG